ncbi:MATE family efflux transporter [Lampropedia puyangensis]|uniref:Multidrug-efflux transporter n=1 Tax=Lampropedia puyangensis TaxID=1330072 RepID=A0A4S8FE47_9BURK|nr:MATE family efflux transporter [Lampropedia puyangensis]THU04152.1 MATE family efflux transporter [Lampropedia puyangensis]
MSERKTIATHASTILVGQLATMAYSITDVMVIGHYSVQAQAALSVAGAIFITVFVSLLSSVQGILPVWAELLGARKLHLLGASVRQSLYLCGTLTLFGVILLLVGPTLLLPLMQVPAEMHGPVRSYLGILSLALPLAMGYRIFVTLSQSIGMPHLVTWLQVAGLAVKVPLTMALVNGWGMLPDMGIAGSAWATVVVQLCLLGLALWLVRHNSTYQALKLWIRLEPLNWSSQRDFARLAIPSGLMASVEVSSFAVMALLISRQGDTITAAHQIASNFAAICYMFPLSLAIAASARVSYWRGAGNADMAQRLAVASLKVGFAIALGLATLLILLREPLTSLYTRDSLVQQTSAMLLYWIALYILADSMQVITIFLLRSWRITLAPMVIYPVMLWGIGVTGGYLLAYHGLLGIAAQNGAWPFWATNVVALTITALSLLYLLRQRLRLPAASANNMPSQQ